MKSRTAGSIIIGLIAAVGALVLTASPVIAVESVYPVEHAKKTLTSRIMTRLRGAIRGMAAEVENVRLKREMAVLSLIHGDLERLEAENTRLRRALALKERAPAEWVAAGVLVVGEGNSGAPAFLRVDRGSLEGVTKGSVVVVPEGLVGRVISVTPHTSKVSVLSDPAEQVHCRVEGADQIRGILSGGQGTVLSLRSLQGTFSSTVSVPVRARVLTSGLGGAFPPGLVIGTWIQFNTNANGVVTGEVLPAVEVSTLEEVFIRRAK